MKLQKLIDRKDAVGEWIIEDITHICKDFEKRDPGSKGELQAAEYYAELLKSYGCEDVKIESFKENPASFMGWIYIAVALGLVAILEYFFAPVISIILIALALCIALLQFGIYKKLVDFLFPEKIGHNVSAVYKPTGEVKRRIAFNGHLDAAWEWPVNYKFGGVGFESHAILGFGTLFFFLVISILRIVKHGAFGMVPDGSALLKIGIWGAVICVPLLISACFLWNERRIVDGANDNLTGCEMGVALVKELSEAGIRLENTEIVVLLTGSEEAGLRGAKAWSEAHAGEWDDVPSFIYSYDTIHDPKQLMVNYRDLNGTVKVDKDVSDLFLEAANELGIFCKKGWVPPMGGATDNAAFAQGGFRSTGITGLNHKLESYYHTRKDSYDNLNLRGIADSYAVTVKTLELFDEGAKQ
ncbi:MAG: M28 family peptidase [Clostridia bacterium]|nr:M28 family peptidase [Clostridia bacterium]